MQHRTIHDAGGQFHFQRRPWIRYFSLPCPAYLVLQLSRLESRCHLGFAEATRNPRIRTPLTGNKAWPWC